LKNPAAYGGVLQENWMMGVASDGKSNSSERPEAQSPIIQKIWNQNEQASGRPTKRFRRKSVSIFVRIPARRRPEAETPAPNGRPQRRNQP
jgi:hypothetical protein